MTDALLLAMHDLRSVLVRKKADRLMKAQKEAAFEFEASAAACETMGRESRGILVPNDVLKRDLTVGTATAGGHTVATDLIAESFIDLLRNRTVVYQRATQMNGLKETRRQKANKHLIK